MNSFVFFAVGVAALGGLFLGYDTGVISGAVLFIKDYAPTIFKFAGIAATGPAILAGAGLTLVMWFFHVLAIFLLDRVGRRPLLLVGVAAPKWLAWSSWGRPSSFRDWQVSKVTLP